MLPTRWRHPPGSFVTRRVTSTDDSDNPRENFLYVFKSKWAR
jgi:hypothetical protein